MHVDRGAFLMFVTSLALGGGAGYVASEKDLVPHMPGRAPPAPPPPPPAPVAASSASAPVASAAPVDAGPVCDDMVGEPEPCPPIGLPTVEGGCGGFALTRCNDFKASMKPRVAKAAVACLVKLTPQERCDPKRVDLCAHLALMTACPEHVASAAAGVAATCDALVTSCASAPVPPSRSECQLALSGLRDPARDAVVDCVKKHCADRGIVGCEATAPPRK